MLTIGTALAQAQSWPKKPVRIVVAGPAGGTADVTARLLADGLEVEYWQAPIMTASARC